MTGKRQYETKVITPAPPADTPTIGVLMAGHGRLTCARCGAVVAACPHLGHQAQAAGTVDGCASCAEVRS